MRFHSAAHGLFHASGHAAPHAFLGHVVHAAYNAMLYTTIYRIMRHVPLPIMVALIAVIALVSYHRIRNTGRAPW
ncbi:hypothetical protein ACLRDC_10440 [Gluconacetobacter sacchari]|uniref:Uncharacterized protein n=2 Tax=Gluconacetobacter sacchari TaxID=92759 RepID=A0A7W4IG93_9PROT|nr:hypothetical protein [Gluconacetobacter sacchari]MBB2162229.1 hypothetical protein [Gluconacetobacter sacchari]GBQ24883.1 hypothetical protein AA12717_1918 [Gluconacetobacter sacchari DSM 12717]